MPADATAVLLVDHEEAERQFIAAALRRQGYWVLEARTRAEALTRVRGCRIDLVVSEIEKRIVRGRTVATRLRRRFPTAQFLFLSGVRQKANIELNGPIIRKPVPRKVLLDRVLEIVGPPKHPDTV